MNEEFKSKGFTIVIAKKSIRQRHGDDVEVYIDNNEKDIILPHYYLDNDFDQDGEIITHLLMSHGNTTLKSLQQVALTQIKSVRCS
jgi:hypothetical protein